MVHVSEHMAEVIKRNLKATMKSTNNQIARGTTPGMGCKKVTYINNFIFISTILKRIERYCNSFFYENVRNLFSVVNIYSDY
jgi:hypothetical protein